MEIAGAATQLGGILGKLVGDPADKIIAAFEPLVAGHALSLSYREPPPQPFGNTIVNFASPTLRLRVTKNRGQFLVDLAPAQLPAEWFDFDVMIELPSALASESPFDLEWKPSGWRQHCFGRFSGTSPWNPRSS